MKNANVAFCVIFWAGKFGVIFWRDFGGGNFGVIFWNFIFENFGGAREVGQAKTTTFVDTSDCCMCCSISSGLELAIM